MESYTLGRTGQGVLGLPECRTGYSRADQGEGGRVRRRSLVFPSDQFLPSAETVRFPSLHRPLACGQYTYPLFGTRLQIANGSAEGPLERGDAICANRTGGGGTLWGQGGQNRKIVAVLLRSWQRCQPYSQNMPTHTLH